MAENETEEAAPASGGKKNLIIFAGVLVVAIGASVGGTLFFLGGESPSEVTDPEPVVTRQEAIYHNMRPPYIINYVTGAKPRYLQAEFTIMSRNEASIEAVVLHMPLIRSEIVSYLSRQSFLELQTQEGKEAIRRGIVDVINNILTSYNVTPGVESAFITAFVLQ